MASFIDGLKQNQQQVQDAEAYRALVRSAEDNSLARNAAAQAMANQVAMQQAAQELNNGRLGLAGQLAGIPVDPTRVQGYVDRLPTPGSVEMNVGSQPMTGYSNAGEMSNVMPRDDQEIRMLKQKGAY